MKFSVGSWSYHVLHEQGVIDLFGYLESMRYRYRLDTADIWNGMIKSLDDDYIQKVQRGLEDRSLTLVNLAIDGADIWDDDASVREHKHRTALAYLRAAETLGAKTVRIDMGPKTNTVTDEQFEFIVNRYREYAQIGYDSGFRVGPQNHNGPTMVPQTNLDIYNAINHPGYGILLDFERWVQDAEFGDETFAKLAMHVHFHTHTILDKLEEKMALLVNNNYEGAISIEYRLGENEYEEVAWELETVKRAWRKLVAAKSEQSETITV